MRQRPIDSLYVLKFLCACLIVFIHVPTLSALMPLSRLGVPCFFMISGYFIASPGAGSRGLARVFERERLTATLRKVVGMMVGIHALYFAATCLLNVLSGYDALLMYADGARIAWSTPRFLLRLVGYGEALAYGTHSTFVFWYLTAYVQALVLFWLATRGGWTRWLWLAVPVGLAASLLLGRYSFLTGGPYSPYVRCNVFTMGLPFVLLGALLRLPSPLSAFMERRRTSTLLTLTLLALAGSAVEYFVQSHFLHLKQMGDVNLCTIPAAIGLMMVALRHPSMPSWCRPFVWLGRHCATGLYLYHILVLYVLLCLGARGLPSGMSLPVNAFSVLAATLALCLVIEGCRSLRLRCAEPPASH